MAPFWIFLAATVVASLSFVAVVVWSESRVKERQEYYRFEFRKRMVEAGKLDGESLAGLMRYEHELGQRQGREKALVASFVLLGAGVGLLFGLRFVEGPLWMLGWVPVAIGSSLLLYSLVMARRSEPGPPPAGWMPKPGAED